MIRCKLEEMRARLIVAVSLGLAVQMTAAQEKGPAEPKDRSHSLHGPAFNSGPRQLARLMPGMGNVHFPITTKSPEAQRYFDQGINLVYSFWWYEAERAFRHAAALDPEAPMP